MIKYNANGGTGTPEDTELIAPGYITIWNDNVLYDVAGNFAQVNTGDELILKTQELVDEKGEYPWHKIHYFYDTRTSYKTVKGGFLKIVGTKHYFSSYGRFNWKSQL